MKPVGTGVCLADVVVVNHNTRDDLHDCLESLSLAHGVGTIWVGDTGSTDGSLEMVRDEFPHVRTLSMPENPGYGAAANQLIARCDNDVVVLLNADVRVDADAVDVLRRHLADHPIVAIAGPRLVNADGVSQSSSFADPTLATLLWRETGLARRRDAARWQGHRSSNNDGSARSVPWVLGAALAIRRSAFDAVGGFDPGYYLYYEETDLCRRVRAGGWEVAFVPSAVATHVGGTSTVQHREAAQRTLYRSLSRYHSIHGGASAWSLRLAVAGIMAARVVRDRALGWAAPCEQRARRQSDATTWQAVLADALRGWKSASIATAPPRRNDWLTLLAAPAASRPAVAVSGEFTTAELDALAVHFGVDMVGRATPRHPADVVVVRAVGRFEPDQVVASVAAGGVALIEHTRRLRGGTLTSARVAAGLSRAGAHVVGRWWVLPDAAQARRFVPLDAPSAVRWYLSNLLIAEGWGRRVARACVHGMPRGAGWIARTHLVSFTRGPLRGPELASRPQLVAAGVDPSARLLVTSSGYDVGSRAIVLPFAPGARQPDVVVKVSGTPAINATTRREHAHLADVRACVSPDLARSMPDPIAVFDWHGHAIAAQSMLDGPTLARVLREQADAPHRIAMLHEATDWITRLHKETSQQASWEAADVERWIREPFARLRDEFELDGEIDHFLKRVEHRANELLGLPVPLVHRHTDLGPWNLIRTASGLGVTDWESAPNRPVTGRGLPVCDLDYFLKYWLHIVADGGGTRVIALFPCLGPVPGGAAAPYVLAARRMMRRYCARIELDPAFVPVLSAYNWVEHTLNRRARDVILGIPGEPNGVALERVRELAAHGDRFGEDPFAVLGPRRSQRRLAIAAPFGVQRVPSHGGARVIGDTAAALAQRHEVRVVSTVGAHEFGHPANATDFTAQEVVRPAQRPLRRMRLLAAALAGRPAWAVEWASPAFERELAATVRRFRPDVVHVEFVVLADALSAIPEEMPVILTDHDPPIGAALDQFRREGWVRRVYRALDAQAWVRTERRAAARATVIVVFSQEDRVLLERLHVAAPVVVMPFAIDLPDVAPDTKPSPPSLAFVGSHHHPPNAEALRYLVDELMPRVWRDRPDVELLAVGTDPPAFLERVDSRIKPTGFVPDLGAVLGEATLVVAPLTSGGGMRVKVLEAIALGKPVVATPLAVRGLPLDAVAATAVVSGDDAFAASVVELLVDDERRVELGRRARRWAEEWLDRDAVADRYDDLYDLVDALREFRS